MSDSRIVSVLELPQWIQTGLRVVHFSGKSVAVTPRLSEHVMSCGADGRRDFVLFLSETSVDAVMYGSWGGPNAYSRSRVDGTDPKYGRDEVRQIEPGAAVISGSEGGGRAASASVSMHPQDFAKLPNRTTAVTAVEQTILNAYMMKAGSHRNDEFLRIACTVHNQAYCQWKQCRDATKLSVEETALSLIERGLLKRTKSGATAVTLAGKNAARSAPYVPAPVGSEESIGVECAVHAISEER